MSDIPVDQSSSSADSAEVGSSDNVTMIPEVVVNSTVQGKEEEKYPNSQNNANARAEVVTGSAEATESAPYCNRLVDKAEEKRNERIAYYDKDDSWIRKKWSGITSMPPYEVFKEMGMDKEADQLRRCIEIASDINDEYERLNEKTKNLNKLLNKEGASNSDIQKAMDDLNASRDAIHQLENTFSDINPDTEIDHWIREAWSYDDRWAITDIGIGIVPIWNASDSAYAATAYFKAGRPGMGTLMTTFAAVDTASSVAVLAGGTGLVSGGAAGGVKGTVKSTIKALLKKSSSDLKALFGLIKSAGQVVTLRRGMREAAEVAALCAKTCLLRK